MLKLKYLFDNRDLALMLVKNWEYDEDSLELFEYFRISSNAIYPFKNKGKVYILRFTPTAEKSAESIKQELKFIEKLSQHAFNVPKVIESKYGHLIETKSTPWGNYHAVVFESVGNDTLENIHLTEKLAYEYGKSLADLHHLSKYVIKATIDRESVFDILNKIEAKTVSNSDYPIAYLNQIRKIRAEFEKLERPETSFGLIHYDYELDNIMYESSTEKLYAIDFDDCMYGFYGQDIERAINSIESEIDEDLQEAIKSSFIQGYVEASGNIEVYLENITLFKSFADLYSYYRIKASLEEKWEHEPLWMENLRHRLTERMRQYIDQLES